MIAQLTEKKHTSAEYLELEAESETRNEFINGEIVPMAGGTTNHNLITGNIYLALRLALKGRSIPVYIENVRLWISEFNVFTYPDVMVIAGEPIYHTETQTTVTNPAVIIEVLSNKTRDYDQGRKFGFYRSLERLQEYVLVEPEQFLIMLYRREKSKEWSLNILDSEIDKLCLHSFNIEIPLTEIYEGVVRKISPPPYSNPQK
jgi:Uma2 family endonuclease